MQTFSAHAVFLGAVLQKATCRKCTSGEEEFLYNAASDVGEVGRGA